MAPRAVVVAGAAAMTLLVASGPARADAPSASWTVPAPGEVAVPADQPIRLEGGATHTGAIDPIDPPGFTNVTFSVVSPGSGCDPSLVVGAFNSDPSAATVPFIYEARFPCNGSYRVTAELATAGSGPVQAQVDFTRSIPGADPDPEPLPALTTPSTVRQGSGSTRIGRGVTPNPTPTTPTGSAEAEVLPFDAAESPSTTTPRGGDLPEDDAAVVAQIEDGDGGDDDARDVAVPVAGGLALLVAAFNLRYVSKRARKAAEADAAREIPPF